MSGANKVFNIALGMEKYYFSLPAANDAILAIPLKSAGLEADDVLRTYDTLSALLAATNDEATFTNYARKVITSGIVITVDDVNHKTTIDVPDQTWNSAGGASNNVLAKVLWCYDPDTTGGTDADIIPVVFSSYDETTTGTSITAQINAGGVLEIVG